MDPALPRNYTCQNCVWRDQCSDDTICDDFAPVDSQNDTYDARSEEREWLNYEEDGGRRRLDIKRELGHSSLHQVSYMEMEDYEVPW